MRATLPVCLVLLLAAPVSGQPALNSKAIAADVIGSLVTVFCGEQSLGSGFYVESPVVATNIHVIAYECTTVRVKRPGAEEQFASDGIVAFSEADDLALIHFPASQAPGKPLEVDVSPVSIGDRVYAAGSPLGYEATFSGGIVSSIRGDTAETLQVSAAVSPGSSGGPVVNEHGLVVGVIVSKASMGERLSFAASAQRVRRLLNAPPIPLLSYADLNAKLENPLQFASPARQLERYLEQMIVVEETEVRAKTSRSVGFGGEQTGIRRQAFASVGQRGDQLAAEDFLEIIGDESLRARVEVEFDAARAREAWTAWGLAAVAGTSAATLAVSAVGVGLVFTDEDELGSAALPMFVGSLVFGTAAVFAGAISGILGLPRLIRSQSMTMTIPRNDMRDAAREYNLKLRKKLGLEDTPVPSGIP